nr:MAG TPA: hypothetical protein [Caudoviricetes sp.]
MKTLTIRSNTSCACLRVLETTQICVPGYRMHRIQQKIAKICVLPCSVLSYRLFIR